MKQERSDKEVVGFDGYKEMQPPRWYRERDLSPSAGRTGRVGELQRLRM